MNSDIRFKSLEDLYKRVRPALESKVGEINKKGYKYIHEEDIWNYLKTYKWTSSRDLDLGDIVNDIFNVDISSLNAFVQDELKEYHRSIKEET